MGSESRMLRRTRDGLRAGWSWWTEDLAAAFPRAAAWLSADAATATIRLGPQHTEVVVRNRPGFEQELTACWPAALAHLDDGQAGELGHLCAGCDVDLLLPQSEVHCMSAWIPRAAGATSETVRYALMTSAPLAIDKMAFDWRRAPAEGATQAEWVEVHVALCRAASLDALATSLARCGVVAGHMAISVQGSERRSAATFTLRRNRRSGAGWVRAQRRKLLLGQIVVTVMVAMTASGLWAQWQAREARREVARLEAQHREFAALAQRQARLDALKAGVTRVAGGSSASAVLNELARLTPVDAWLLELRLDGERLKAVGRAAKPTGLTGGFAQSKALGNVRLDSVSAAAGPDSVAAFELSATAKGQP
jgi:hypothetical protein